MQPQKNKIPRVSVVMATFNEPEDIIRPAIESIMRQTLTDWELLIIDDSTTSETIKAINELANKDSRIIVIRKPSRIGFVKALNTGLRKARGAYIARMDGDDISKPDRFRIQINFLDNNSQYDVVGGAMNIINREGNIISHRSYPSSSLSLKLWTILRSPLAHPSVMMRRKIIDNGFFYDKNFSRSEDLELWLRLMKNGYRFYNLSIPLLKYRVIGDLEKKRPRDQFIYNYKARLKNFSWKSPITSIVSLFISITYLTTPRFIIKFIYSWENNRKIIPQRINQ
jgi:glycosyltransferase involved in cell wall biosynthesis